MENKQAMLDYLENFSKNFPNLVINSLSRGSRVNKNLSQQYEIDNANIDEDLGKFPVGAIPYNHINRALRSNGSELRALLSRDTFIPFSKVVKAGLGQCLEKAVLVQLAAQRAGKTYLINGALELDDDIGADFHAFNLVARAENIYLVDTENPLSLNKDGSVLRPYVVPVKDISKNGTIIVPDAYRFGRTYCFD
jgi:hypothetical protein